MPYVFSTMSAPVEYTAYKKDHNDLPVPDGDSVLIKGHANVMDTQAIVTPKGTATQVSEDQLEWLKEHPLFKTHQKNGYVSFGSSAADPNRRAEDMAAKDGSAPRTPEDYKPNTVDENGNPIRVENGQQVAQPKTKAELEKKQS